MRTFLERDIPQLGFQVPAEQLRRFWSMTAHYHAQIWNSSEIAGSLGVSHPTVSRNLDILCGAFVLRRVPPWHVNIGKRLVKSPKVYLRDTGLLHYFLGIRDRNDLLGHPKLGASWEGLEKVAAIPISALAAGTKGLLKSSAGRPLRRGAE